MKGDNNMSRKYLVISSVLFLALVTVFAVGYYAMNNIKSANKVNDLKSNNNNLTAKAVDNLSDNLNNDSDYVSSNTIIVKKEKYIEGIPTVVTLTEKASKDIIGMDNKGVTEYYRKLGFLLTSYSNKEIQLSQDVKAWPPNYYIVKVENNKIKIFHTNENSVMTFRYDYNMDIDQLPDADLNNLIKGRAFETTEQINAMFDEYKS